MTTKIYDLEERTLEFAKNVNLILRKKKVSLYNKNCIDQVLKSSSSVGDNYIEANEALSKKDFLFRIKICRKEAKETAYWLKILFETDGENPEINKLFNEAIELEKILSAIVEKSK